jgi:bifunctional non-homologous end joining protein LigD
MMAESAKAPFDSPDWIFEIKLDGYRAVASKEGEDVCLLSHNKKAFAYSQLLDA